MCPKSNKTTVVNIKKEKYDVYIGRPSIFGNPFRIGWDGTREEVIALYKAYFYNRVENDPQFLEEIQSLKNKKLGCFCKPKDCHGDIIVEYLN